MNSATHHARLALLLGAVAACTSPAEMTTPRALTGAGPFLVSSPVASGPAATARPQGSSGLTQVAYVSLPPGALSGGTGVTILVVRTGVVVTTSLIDGGFDPVAVPAVVGDTIVLTVTPAVPGATAYTFTIPADRPPVIVRTEPPRQKRDVPLNLRLVVVFSEPIAETSLTPDNFVLRADSTVVAGQLAFADSARTTVVFTPAAPLAPARDYELVLWPGIHDDNGRPLEAETRIPFSTAQGQPPPDSSAQGSAAHRVTVWSYGDGAGEVVSDPAGIACTVTAGWVSGTCSAGFAAGTPVTLTATGAFSAWSGNCSGPATAVTCGLPALAGDNSVAVGFGAITSWTATFAPITGTHESTLGLIDIGVPAFLTSDAAHQWIAKAKVTVSAKLHLIGHPGTVALTGTYDATPGGRQLCLLEAPAGVADPCISPSPNVWQFKGVVDSLGAGRGTLSGPDPTTPGASAAGSFRVEDNGAVIPCVPGYAGCSFVRRQLAAFCGPILDWSQRELGRWVVTLFRHVGYDPSRRGGFIDYTVGGFANHAGSLYIINGRLVNGGGVAPPAKAIGLTTVANAPFDFSATASGSASVRRGVRVGDSIGGTWSSGGASGVWSATTGGCK